MKGYITLFLFFISTIFTASCSKQKQQQIKPVAVTVAKPQLKDVPIFIEVPGHMEAYQAVKIRPEVSGLVTNIYYEEGKKINEGDMMVTIDDRPYVADLQKSEAMLEKAEAQFKYAKDTYIRNIPLAEEAFISQESFEDLATNVAVIKAEIDQTLAQIAIAKINLGYCFIKAPITGIAGNKLIDIGNLVVQNSSESTLVTINQISPIYGTFFVPEKDLIEIIKATHTSKNPLPVLVSYYEDFSEAFTGALEFINNEVEEDTGMIKLKGTFDNKEEILWPGQFVNVRLVLYTQKNAVTIPSRAVQRNSKGAFVYVINSNNKAQLQMIQLGQLTDDYYIVEKGLKEDDTVVINGQLQLYPDALVSVKTSEGPSL